MTPPTFLIYNASAGSGKTYTLVQEMLASILISDQTDSYRQLLAVTFTNKAAAEMRTRVLQNLVSLSSSKALESPNTMMLELVEKTHTSLETLHHRAQKLLPRLLHDYGSFHVSTIDGFTHRLIRAFSYELKLPFGFEVTTQSKELLSEAVERVLAKAGIDEKLTNRMRNFAAFKWESNLSWDIGRDFHNTARLLLNENHYQNLRSYRKLSEEAIENIERNIAVKYQTLVETLNKKATKIQEEWRLMGLEDNDFKSHYFRNFVIGILNRRWEVAGMGGIASQIEDGKLYTQKASADKVAIHQQFFPAALNFYQEVMTLAPLCAQLEAFKKTFSPLVILKDIQEALIDILAEQQAMLVSEFNAKIAEAINGHPTPMIYERLGVKYRYFFIDEFQDTSQMQWNNLIPLVSHAVESEETDGSKGLLMLVGDPKQSIYRWRGGKASLLMSLSNGDSPFSISPTTKDLKNNYRSFDNIVNFNNKFFRYAASFLDHPDYQKLYQHVAQQSGDKKGGYISLDFIDPEENDSVEALYSEKVLQAIQKSQGLGFSYGEMCVLVRTNKSGVALANALSEQNIPIISSESILLDSSLKVQLLVAFIAFRQTNERHDTRAHLMILLSKFRKNTQKLYDRLTNSRFETSVQFFESLSYFNFKMDFQYFSNASLYSLLEQLISALNMDEDPDAFLQFFLDFAHKTIHQHGENDLVFLEKWEENKKKLSVNLGDISTDAVRILTIHKAKGLEFPVVIFPFAHDNFQSVKTDYDWFPVAPQDFMGCDRMLVSATKQLDQMGPEGKALATQRKQNNTFDEVNTLYVALTRAKEQLYIISKKENIKDTPSSYAQLFRSFVEKERPDQQVFPITWGDDKRCSRPEGLAINSSQIPWVRSQNRHKLLFKTRAKSLKYSAEQDLGTKFHEFMAQINFDTDLDWAVAKATKQGLAKTEMLNTIVETARNLIHDPKTANFYSSRNSVFNERPIIFEGKLLIPDRIIITPEGESIVIDYKTGKMEDAHHDQIQQYAKALKNIGLKNVSTCICYLFPNLEIRWKKEA